MNMVKKDTDDSATAGSSTADYDGSGGGAFELATATHWPGVQQDVVLIAPHEARLAWREFMTASALSVQQVGRRINPGGCHVAPRSLSAPHGHSFSLDACMP